MKKIFLLSALLVLSACAQPVVTGNYVPEVSDADRQFAANSIWGPDESCVNSAQAKGLPRERATVYCGCVKGIMATRISNETIRYIVVNRPMTGADVPRPIMADAEQAGEYALKICTGQ